MACETDRDGLTDGDEISNGSSPNNEDTDGDGIPDGAELGDTDGDGIPDNQEIDSDNDDIKDVIEADLNIADVDADGRVDDFVDADNNGLHDPIPTGFTPIDVDGDTVADFRSLDSDGDGLTDLFEVQLSSVDLITMESLTIWATSITTACQT